MKPSNITITPKLDLFQESSASTIIIDNSYEELKERNAVLKAPALFKSSFNNYTSKTYGKQNADIYPQLNTSLSATNIVCPQLNTSISATNFAYDDDDDAIVDEGLESSDDEVILF
jgi:hypothetical protein